MAGCFSKWIVVEYVLVSGNLKQGGISVKKNKKLMSLFMAAMIMMSSVPVYGAEADAAATPDVQTQSTDNVDAASTTDTTESQTDTTGNQTDTTGNQTDTTGSQTDTTGSQEETSENTDTQTGTSDSNATVEGTVVQEQQPAANVQGEVQQQTNIQGEVITDVNNDEVEIKENDRPYLALGADLTEEQRNTVLSLMGVNPVNLSQYDVVYVTNAEEHQYLGSYIDASQIGSKSLSSVVIVEREKGSGLNISTNNITFCTVGMYKNALVTAGITDADIIVAGPTGISGTAALVGIFKAYEEMTGETVDEAVVDVALNELVLTGQLESALEGVSDEEVEEFIAYIKAVVAENNLTDEASINEVIDEACEKYGVTLTDSERQQIIDLLLKLTSLGIDLNGLVDYAESLYNSYKAGTGIEGIFSSIANFFSNIFTAIADFFEGLFS